MALPVGEISLSQVNVELTRPSTQEISMNEAEVRTLAGVGGAGTVISMSNLQGKSNRIAISLIIAAPTNNYNIFTNRSPFYQPGISDITLTINPGVFVGGGAPGAEALSLPSQFSPADTVTIINQGVVIGRGGAGGRGGTTPTPLRNGSSGTRAFITQRPVIIQNQGTFAGGGGGGGGGLPGIQPRPRKQGGPITRLGGGGGGGAGVSGGGGGPPNGGTGTTTSGGAGGPAISPAQTGGPGGGRGSPGTPRRPTGGFAGGAGQYAAGSPLITWQETGTRQGGAE